MHVDAAGYVTLVSDGTAQIIARVDNQDVVVEVSVQQTVGRSVDFRTEIVPLLSRYGCNAGGCHGKKGGQNGFQLSLFGFNHAFDHDAIVKEARGRRIFVSSPSESLLLRKAVGQSPHGGGARFAADSEAYRLMRRWIENGAAAASSDAAHVVALHVAPKDRVLKREGRQQLAIATEYSDGTWRDVTRQSQFSSNLEPVASVSENGLVVSSGESGEAAVMARYMGHVAVFRAIVPHGRPLTEITGFQPTNYVDELTAAKWMKLGLVPSPVCDDETFIRRVTIDLCGRLPTADETRGFLADASADKRSRWIDRLLDSLDNIRRDIDLAGDIEGLDKFYRDGLEMVTNDKAVQAFDIKQENSELRERYGRNDLGQSCLLARRLVEAGVSYVAIQAGGGWDTHGDNFKSLKNNLLPNYDRAVATLVSDLHDRGLQDDVLVMSFSEFGRTPRINSGAGRDHWPGAMSVL